MPYSKYFYITFEEGFYTDLFRVKVFWFVMFSLSPKSFEGVGHRLKVFRHQGLVGVGGLVGSQGTIPVPKHATFGLKSFGSGSRPLLTWIRIQILPKPKI